MTTQVAPVAEVPITRDQWRLALVIVFGAFMSGLDASVVNVGLDTIADDLHATLGTAQWVTTGYLLAFGISLPACGWVGRRWGVGRLWLWALTGFTASSVLCALAPSIGLLIAARVLQGATAGLLIPAGQTILGQAVGPHRLGRVMATLGVAVTVAPAIGPTVGGLLIDVGAWPWLFLVNLPLGITGVVLGRRFVPRGEPRHGAPMDWRGLVLVTAGLPLVVYGCTAWGEHAHLLRAGVVVPLGAGVAALVAFVAHARRRADPILDLRLFRSPVYVAACATAAATGAALFGAGLIFPLFFQVGRGEGIVATGLLLVSLSLGTVVVLPWSGRLVDRYGGGVVSTWGGLAAVATTVPFALLPVDAPELVVQGLLLLRGGAVALAVVPAGTAAYKAVTVDQLPDATTQVNILQRVGGALGGSIFAVLLAARLPDASEAAFHAAFWALTLASALGLGAACWLRSAEGRVRSSP